MTPNSNYIEIRDVYIEVFIQLAGIKVEQVFHHLIRTSSDLID